MLLNRVLLPGVHLHLLVLVAHQRLVAVAVRLHGAERRLRQAQAWETPRAFKHRRGTTANTAPGRHASLLFTDFFRRNEQAEEDDHPSGELHHRRHQEGVLHTATQSMSACLRSASDPSVSAWNLTSYPYFSTLEARNAPRMLPTGAQALHRPNTKPRLGLEKTSLVLKRPRRELKCLQPPPLRFYI